MTHYSWAPSSRSAQLSSTGVLGWDLGPCPASVPSPALELLVLGTLKLCQHGPSASAQSRAHLGEFGVPSPSPAWLVKVSVVKMVPLGHHTEPWRLFFSN